MVKVKVVAATSIVKSITIDPEAIDPEDPELLQDMVARRGQRGRCAPPRSSPQSKLGGARRAAWTSAALGPAGPLASRARVVRAPVQRLITELGKLPGIGSAPPSGWRSTSCAPSAEDALALADAIREVKEKIGLCEVCFNLADEPRCRICQDERRDPALICVVEEPGDVIPIERTHEYRGRYHVLGGALSPIDGVDPEDLKIAELYARVAAPARVREVVLATNPTTTGEATALHIADGAARARAGRHGHAPGVSGLPVGSDLEYADEVTLGKALSRAAARCSASVPIHPIRVMARHPS